jgi:hypothetical protein
MGMSKSTTPSDQLLAATNFANFSSRFRRIHQEAPSVATLRA